MENYKKTLTWFDNKFNEKLSHYAHSRSRRGLVNGLGTIIKWISGNADAYDVEHFETAIQKLQTTQNHYEKYVSKNVVLYNKVSKALTQLDQNQLQFNKEILTLQNHTNENEFIIKMNQINTFLGTSLSELTDIETAVTFCKIGLIHPTIISRDDLHTSLTHIASMFPNEQFPEDSVDFYSTLTSTSCIIHDYKIIIGIHIPLYEKNKYDFLSLNPLPHVQNTQLVKLLLEVPFVLYNNVSTIGIKAKCTQLDNKFYCNHNSIIDLNPIGCIPNLLARKIDNCQVVRISDLPLIEQIPDTSDYILYFKDVKNINLQCKDLNADHSLQGIYIARLRKCILRIDNKTFNGLPDVHTKINILTGNFNYSVAMNKITFKYEEIPSIKEIQTLTSQMESISTNIDLTAEANYFKSLLSSLPLPLVIATILIVYYIRKRYSNKNDVILANRTKYIPMVQSAPQPTAPISALPDKVINRMTLDGIAPENQARLLQEFPWIKVIRPEYSS